MIADAVVERSLTMLSSRRTTPTTCVLVLLIMLVMVASDGAALQSSAQSPDIVVTPSGPISSIQEAIDILADTGGTILVKAGTYVISEPLSMNGISGLTIRGEGDLTVITPADGTNAFSIFKIFSCASITLGDLAIDGNKLNVIPPPPGDYAWELGNGVFINESTGCIVENLLVERCTMYGVVFRRADEGSWIRGCRVNDNGGRVNEAGDGIQLYRCHGVQVTDNFVSGNFWAGIQSTWRDSIEDDAANVISSNVIVGNRCHGIVLYSTNRNVVSGNTIRGLFGTSLGCGQNASDPEDATEIGVLVQGNGNVVSSNTISGFERGIWVWHVREEEGLTGSSETLIEGNTIWEVLYDGIQVLRNPELSANPSAISTTTIADNDISGTGYHGISVYRCPGQAITGNRVHSTQKNGIYLGESGESVIASNICLNNGLWQGAEGIDAIAVNGPSADVVVNGNIARRSQRYGVYCYSDSANNVVVGNACTGNPSGGVSCDGPTNVVVANLPGAQRSCDPNADGTTDAADISTLLACVGFE